MELIAVDDTGGFWRARSLFLVALPFGYTGVD